MSEERLKEIKDSIEIQYKIAEARNNDHYIIDEELELYNEVIRLQRESEDLKLLLNHAKMMLPIYYGELIDQINQVLKK